MITCGQKTCLDCEEEGALKGTFFHLVTHLFIQHIFIEYISSARDCFSTVVIAVNKNFILPRSLHLGAGRHITNKSVSAKERELC